MLLGMLKGVVEKQATKGVHHLRAVPPREARGVVAEVYEQVRREMMLAPPFVLHSPIPDLLAASWAIVRESLIAGEAPRGEKELVAAGVSKANACPYCVDAHGASVHATLGGSAAEAADRDEPEALDEVRRRIYLWAKATASAEAAGDAALPFDAQTAPELIGTALAFHHVNRVVNVFCDEAPMPVSASMKPVARAMSAPVMRPMLAERVEPGTSLEALRDAGADAGPAWASPNPIIQKAFGHFRGAVERSARPLLSEAVDALLRERMSRWRGGPAPLSRAWVEDEVAPLEGAERETARLALLSAKASFQIDDEAIAAFRAHAPSDEALLGVVCYGSLLAIERIEQWIRLPASGS